MKLHKMPIFMIALAVIIATTVYPQSSAQQKLDASLKELENNLRPRIKAVTLGNGLRLIMMRKDNAPVVAAYMKFKVGSVDETGPIAGTAHLLEHMLFKGSHKLGTTNYAKEKKYLDIIESWGSLLDEKKLRMRDLHNRLSAAEREKLEDEIKQLNARLKQVQKQHSAYVVKEHDALIYNAHGQTGFNAYTSKDVTNYQIQLPANKLELWAAIESDRLKTPILREYYVERDVVIEERRMRYESIGFRKLREQFLATAFENHPYRRPIIGYMSNIPYLNKAETEAFFRRYYSPDNMVITLVGDVDFAYAEKLVKSYFGSLKPQGKRPLNRLVNPQQNGEKRIQVQYPSGRKLIIGWHKPTYPSKDNAAFELLSRILTDGRGSLLVKKLVHEKHVALDVSSWNGDPGERYDNLFSIYVTPLGKSTTAEIEKLIYLEIEKIKNGQLSAETVNKYKNRMAVDAYRHLNSNAGLADLLSYCEIVYGSWDNLFNLYRDLNSLSPEDLQAAAKQYLVSQNRTVGELVKSEK